MTLLRLFHSDTVTVVPHWYCYDCSTTTLLRLFQSDTAAIVPQWHCFDCSTVTRLRLFYSDTATIVQQWDRCDRSIVTLLRFFHSGTVTIVPQLQRYNCSTLTLLRLFQLSRQILVPRMPRGRLFPTSSGQPLKIPFDHTGDVPIWCSRGVPKWRPGNVLIWHPRDVQRTFSGRPLEDFQNTSLGRCAVTYWMSLNFFLLFFRNLFDWPNLYKSNSVLKVYLEPSRTSKMELFFAKLVNGSYPLTIFVKELHRGNSPGF